MKQRKHRRKLANRLQRSMYAYGGIAKPMEDEFDYGANTAKGIGTGALSGAAAGASMGSVIPGWGTAVGAAAGAVIGGVGGAFTSDAENAAQRSKFNAQKLAEIKRKEEIQNTVLGDFPAQGFEGGTFNAKYGGKLPYAVGGVHTVNRKGNLEPKPKPKPKPKKFKTVTVDMEKEYGFHPNSIEGNELGFKLAKEGLAEGITYRFKCSGGQQCAGAVNTLEQNIGKRLQEEVNVLKNDLSSITPEWAKAGEDYLKLVNEEIPNLGVYKQKDAWTPTDASYAETLYMSPFAKKQYEDIPISERTTPLEYNPDGTLPKEVIMNPAYDYAAFGGDRRNTDSSTRYGKDRVGKNKAGNKGIEHVMRFGKGTVTDPITGEVGRLYSSQYATADEGGGTGGQAYNTFGFASETQPIGHH